VTTRRRRTKRGTAWAKEIEEVYVEIDRIDLMTGMYAEDRPEGFAFSDTAFRIFILMASRRLNSDLLHRQLQERCLHARGDGLARRQHDGGTVLKRHFPSLAPYVDATDNAFALWKRPGH
jgi:hypothetical protein